MSKHIRLVAKKAATQDAAEADDRILTWTMSVGSDDRAGDLINQNGWMLDNYKANPIVLWAHNSTLPPIGKCVALGYDTEGNLTGKIQFGTKDMNPFADQVYRMAKDGFINAGSVGFLAHAYEPRYDDDGRFKGIAFNKQELTEFSICPVPMHPDALCIARSFGADTGLLNMQVKDETDYSALKAELKALRAAPIKAARLKALAAINRSKVKLMSL